MNDVDINEKVFEKIVSDDWGSEVNKVKKLMTFYHCALMEVETKFKVISAELSLNYDSNPIESIKTRIKSVDGILKKLKKKGLDVTTDNIENNIFDIAGVRVICSYEDEIYSLIESFLNQEDVYLVEIKDYIKNPKESGYRSVHLIIEIPIFLYNETKRVKVEIQFRTLAMDVWASLEHKIRYKKDLNDEKLKLINDTLLKCAELCKTVDYIMGDLKDISDDPDI